MHPKIYHQQVALNVTDMDKINTVSSQAVLEMSFSMDTRSSPLVNSLVKNRLFKTTPDIDESPFQFIHTMNLSLVDTICCMTAHILQSIGLRSGLFGGHRLGTRKLGISWRSSSTVARARRGVPAHCPVHSAYCWQYDVIMTSWRSQ